MAPQHSNDSYGNPGAGNSVPLGDNSDTSDIVEQARGRSDGFEMGDDRAIVTTPNWNSQESNQLYHGAVTNNEPGTAESTGHAWASHGHELSQASNHLYNAISELGSAWIGEGAAAAQGALVGIANSGSQASEAAHTMANRLAQQAVAAAEVKKMPKPLDYDPAKTMTAALAGGPAAMIADQKAQADAAADVKAQQVAFFNAYTNAMSDVDSSTPSFGPESLGLKPVNGTNAANLAQLDSGVNPGGGPGTGPGVGNVFNHTVPGGSHGAAPAAAVSHSTPVTPGGHEPFAGAQAPGSASGSQVSSASAPSAGSGHLGQALGIGGVGGALGVAGARKLGLGSRSGTKSDKTAASANESGQSAASTAAPTQGVVPQSGTIGGAQTPPPGGMGGMGGGGMRGGQQQEDEEHTHASFLIDADPDETFGANEATPPPVIGAWSEDDDR